MTFRPTARRIGGGVGLLALVLLLTGGVLAAACGECSEHSRGMDMVGMEMVMDGHVHTDTATPSSEPMDEGSSRAPCCDHSEMQEAQGGTGSSELPICPHSILASGCSSVGSFPSARAELHQGMRASHHALAVVQDAPTSVVPVPPFQPPRA